MASNSILVRGIPEDIRSWIEDQCSQLRVTQQEFLLSLLSNASKPSDGPTLFDVAALAASEKVRARIDSLSASSTCLPESVVCDSALKQLEDGAFFRPSGMNIARRHIRLGSMRFHWAT